VEIPLGGDLYAKGGVSSLDNSVHNVPLVSGWSRRQRRLYHRAMSGIEWATARGLELRGMCLTSSLDSPKDRVEFRRNWHVLVKRLRRRLPEFEYIANTEFTSSGLMHLHVVYRGGFINQKWLSATWQELHRAKIVYIQHFRGGKKRLGAYLCKYFSKTSDPKNRYWWSRRWVYRGFVKDWRWLVRNYGDQAVARWKFLLRLGITSRIRPDIWVRLGIPPPNQVKL